MRDELAADSCRVLAGRSWTGDLGSQRMRGILDPAPCML
jgi:hypothetical protein